MARSDRPDTRIQRPEDRFPPADKKARKTANDVSDAFAAHLIAADPHPQYVLSTRLINTTAPLAGGGDLTADLTLSITAATGAAAGSMSAADKTKLDAISGTNTGDQTSIVGITGSLAEFNAALTGADFATGGGTVTGTNTGDQTSIVGITGTKTEFNTAVTDGDFLYVGDVSNPDDTVYGVAWNGSLLAPTQNAVYDKIETLQPLDADLTAIAALVTTAFGRDHLVLADAAALRTKAGLGTAAVKNTGTSGNNVALLDGANTWSSKQIVNSINVTGGGFTVGAVGQLYGSATLGAVLAGQGSTYDIYWANKNGAAVIQLPTGTINPEFLGDISVAAARVYKVSGVQVVKARIAGWSVDTGTAKRTANATYSGTAEAAYTQATIQTLMNAVRDLSQTIKALKDDLHSTAGHGLIGP